MMLGQKEDESYDTFISSSYTNFLENGRCLGFLGFPSSKDPDFNNRFPGKSTAVLISELKWDEVKEWKDDRWDHRDDDYQGLKKQWADALVRMCVWKHFPELEKRCTYMKVGTPLSAAWFLGKDKGE